MTKKILFFLILAFTLISTGCTSNSSQSEDGNPDQAQAADGGDAPPGDAVAGDKADKGGNGELDLDKQIEGADDLSADLGDGASDQAKAGGKEQGLPDDTLGTPPPAQDTPPAEPAKVADAPPPAPAEPPPADTAPPPDTSAVAATAPKASLKKVKDAPFNAKDGAVLNAVYIARNGDTMSSVSTTIYGSDRGKDLKKWNPSLSKKLKVGDKVYYNSPQRPTDSTKMAVYFEDMGVAPQVHTTADGENLKSLGKTLLGHKDSWKELWETNPNLESKTGLTAGLEIRYWPQDTKAAPPPAPGGDALPPAPDTNAPPAPTLADNKIPPPPPPPPGPGGKNLPPPPPPPPDGAAAGSLEPPSLPPPPPPPTDLPKKAAKVQEAQGPDTDLMMTAGVALVIIVALVALVMIRKNRAKRMDFGQTQV